MAAVHGNGNGNGGCTPWPHGSGNGMDADGQVLPQCSFLRGEAILSQEIGWGILCGAGAILSLLTMSLMFLTIRYDRGKRYRLTADNFTTANRLMGSGFTASVLVSQWTWVATLVQSSNMAWRYGIAGPFWYAAGAAVQMVLFSVLAVQVKRKAPGAHTICEIVLARWGHSAHLVFVFFCLLTNILVTTMLVMGGANVLSALTGISRMGSAVVLPLVVTFHTVQGGFRATYLAGVWHNLFMFVATLLFCFRVFASDSELGNPDKVYQRLSDMGSLYPVEGNRQGSFLTFWSQQGVLFGVVNLVGNFGTVFVDQGFWQTAFACKNPLAARRGFILGGLAWFSIPFAMATAMGLGARALNLPLSPEEADMGLVPAAVAMHLFGTTGAVVFAIQVVTAVASSGSSQQLAVASIITFDIYKRYINPGATAEQVIRTSRLIIVLFGCLSGTFAVLATEGIDLSLDWIYISQGVFLGSSVIPIAFCIMWRDCTGLGAISGALGGLLLGIMSWTASSHIIFGSVTVVTLRKDYPVMIGNLVSILSSGLIAVVVSLFKPQRYVWQEMRELMRCFLVDPLIGVAEELESRFDETMYEQSRKVMRRGIVHSSTIAFILVVLWPLLALCEDVVSPAHFKFLVFLSIAWALVCSSILLVVPLYEARGSAVRMFESIFQKAGEIASIIGSSLGSTVTSTAGSVDHSWHRASSLGSHGSSKRITMPRIVFPDSSTVKGILKRIPSDSVPSVCNRLPSAGKWYLPHRMSSTGAAVDPQRVAMQTPLTDVEIAIDPPASSDDSDAASKPAASVDASGGHECGDVHLAVDGHQCVRVGPMLDECGQQTAEGCLDVEIEPDGRKEGLERARSTVPQGPRQQSPTSSPNRFSRIEARFNAVGNTSSATCDDEARVDTLKSCLVDEPMPGIQGSDGVDFEDKRYPADVSGKQLFVARRPRFEPCADWPQNRII